MSGSRLQQQRFELKYLIEEARAQRVRQFVQAYLPLDEYGVGQPDHAYPVHSLYVDSLELDTYWHTINGNKNRFKLRLRYYDDRPDSPIFFEVKRRMNNIILKQRAGVRRAAVPLLLAGHFPEDQHLLSATPEERHAAEHFVELMCRANARPKLHVAYRREAYEDPEDNAVRVTLDRAVVSAPQPRPDPVVSSRCPHPVFGATVVLELKFTERHPNWFRELVEEFDCMQSGAAKYAEGIYTRGEDWANRPHHRLTAEELVQEFLGGASS